MQGVAQRAGRGVFAFSTAIHSCVLCVCIQYSVHCCSLYTE